MLLLFQKPHLSLIRRQAIRVYGVGSDVRRFLGPRLSPFNVKARFWWKAKHALLSHRPPALLSFPFVQQVIERKRKCMKEGPGPPNHWNIRQRKTPQLSTFLSFFSRIVLQHNDEIKLEALCSLLCLAPCHSCSFSLSFSLSLSLSSVERQRRHGHAMRRRKRQYWFFGPQHSPPQSQRNPPPLSVLNWTPKHKAPSLIFTCCAPLFRKDTTVFLLKSRREEEKSIFGVFPAYNNCVFPQNNIQDWPDDMKISHEAFEEYAARIEQDDFEVCN